MGWEDQKSEPKTEPEKVPEKAPEVPEVKVEPPVDVPPAPEPPKEAQEEMVPQKLIGKIAKGLREKHKVDMAGERERIRQLEEENRKLKEGSYSDPTEPEEDAKIERKVQEAWLRRQDAYGRKKYGKDYDDALLLIASQSDPILVAKIQGAASPAEELMAEAVRIAENLEFGSDPKEREAQRLKSLEAELRKKIEAETLEKLKARGNQPTDVQNVRAAGGDDKPRFVPDSWSTGRGALPR